MYEQTKIYSQKQIFMNQLEHTEWIDLYLAGTLPPADKMEFERLLSDPESSLLSEMQLQQDIIMAIRERGMREMLQAEECRRHRQKLFWRISSVSLISLAMAAALALLLIIAPLARQMFPYSEQYAVTLNNSQAMRSGEITDPLLQQLHQAQTFITQNNWREADRLAVEVMKQTKSTETEEQLDLYTDAEWLHDQCLMHLNCPLQARRLLKKIASDNGYYNKQAQNILDKIK